MKSLGASRVIFLVREAVDLALRKIELDNAARAKKEKFAAGLQVGLHEGAGRRKTPLSMDDFEEDERKMLEGLKVRPRSRDECNDIELCERVSQITISHCE